MNKLTKVGFSALCGSLAAVSSVNAGEMTVTGGVDMSWISKESDVTGNPIGMGSNLTFKGSGEFDNGWTFSIAVANANGNAYSATDFDLTMGGLGSIDIDQGDSSNGIAAYDDKMPTAWEEAWGNGLSTGVKTVVGVGSSMNIQYTTPKVFGLTIALAYAPEIGATDTADKASSGQVTAEYDRAYDAVINLNPSFGTEVLSGLNLFVGGHTKNQNANGGAANGHYYEGVAGITYDVGPISLGYGQAGSITGSEVTATHVSHYRSNMYGVAFNINDDLSVSYGHYESRKAGYVNASQSMPSEQNRRVEVDSYQIAYTMGGASLRLANTKGDNLYFSSANDKDVKILSVSLAF